MNKEQIASLTFRRLKAKKMSQSDLCREIGLTPCYLSLFLSGKKPPPAALLAWLGYGQKTVYYKLGDK